MACIETFAAFVYCQSNFAPIILRHWSKRVKRDESSSSYFYYFYDNDTKSFPFILSTSFHDYILVDGEFGSKVS